VPRTRRSLLLRTGLVLCPLVAGCTSSTPPKSAPKRSTETTDATGEATADSVTTTDTPTRTATRTPTSRPTATETPSPSDFPVSERDSITRAVPFGLSKEVPDGDLARAFVVGGTAWVDDSHHAHQVWLWNGSTSTWTGTVELAIPTGGILTESVALSAADAVAFRFREPASYTLTLTSAAETVETDRVAASDSPIQVVVDPERFDCNDSATDVVFDNDGVVDQSTISTELACTE
jgi:hypothetical protein